MASYFKLYTLGVVFAMGMLAMPVLAAAGDAAGDSAPATELPAPATELPAPATELPAPATELPAPATELPAPATELPAPATELPTGGSFEDELLQGFYWRVNVLAFGIGQDLRHDSRVNPDNFLRIPNYEAALNPRVDLNLNVRQFEFGVKPRFLYLWQRYDEGLPDGQQDNRTELYVNEWIARYRPMDELSVSYGRENLQWGPSIILSSSNSFNQQNGQANPWLEVPGLDYARAVWIPSSNWASSFIANTDKGRLGESLGFEINANEPSLDFKKGYAFKVDWTGDGKYFSVIPSYREDTGYRFGFFGGWNVSDALLLYTEGAEGNYDGLQFQAGGSYTFEAGMTVHLEYYYNGDGCVSKKIDRCFRDGDASFRDAFFRGNYIMLQYSDHDIWDVFGMTFRLLNGLNDHSSQLTGLFEYEVGENTQLYLVGTGFMGGRDSEFGSLLNYSLFGGVSYTF